MHRAPVVPHCLLTKLPLRIQIMKILAKASTIRSARQAAEAAPVLNLYHWDAGRLQAADVVSRQAVIKYALRP